MPCPWPCFLAFHACPSRGKGPEGKARTALIARSRRQNVLRTLVLPIFQSSPAPQHQPAPRRPLTPLLLLASSGGVPQRPRPAPAPVSPAPPCCHPPRPHPVADSALAAPWPPAPGPPPCSSRSSPSREDTRLSTWLSACRGEARERMGYA